MDNGTNLDGGVVGSSDTATDDTSSQNVSLTINDIIGFSTDYQGSPLTSVVDDGASHKTNGSGNVYAIGVNSSGSGGYNNEFRDFNPGETLVFSFRSAVSLDNIDFPSFNESATHMTISSAEFSDIVISDADINVDETYNSASVVIVSAHSNITITMSTTGAYAR